MPRLSETLYAYKPDNTILQLLTPKAGEPDGVTVTPHVDRDGTKLMVALPTAKRPVMVNWSVDAPTGQGSPLAHLSVVVLDDEALMSANAALKLLKSRITS